MDSEVDISRKNFIKRLKELDQFKHSGSVEEGEIVKLQEFLKTLEGEATDILLRLHKEYEGLSKRQKKKKNVEELNRMVTRIESLKICIKTGNECLDECEERFRKYNIPKRCQNGHKQPLKTYVERLHEFMEITWRKETKKNREKRYLNLYELMIKMGIPNNHDEVGLFIFDSLLVCFQQIGTQISSFLIEYFFLIIIASNESSEIVSLSLFELKTVLECLYVEEKYGNSIVINTFVTIVCFFMHAMELAGPFWDNEKSLVNKGEEKKKMYYLDEEMEDNVVHLIIMEVLRFEVSFCSPKFIPGMPLNLEHNVFKEKFERVADKIEEWKFYIEFIQEGDDQDHEDCPEIKFLRQVLEAGVHEIFTDHDNSSWTLLNLLSI